MVTTNKSAFFSNELACFWSIIDLQHYPRSCYTTQWFDISIHFEMITVSLAAVCHHTEIRHSCRLHSEHYVFHTCDVYSVTQSSHLFLPALLFLSFLHPLLRFSIPWFSVIRSLLFATTRYHPRDESKDPSVCSRNNTYSTQNMLWHVLDAHQRAAKWLQELVTEWHGPERMITL